MKDFDFILDGGVSNLFDVNGTVSDKGIYAPKYSDGQKNVYTSVLRLLPNPNDIRHSIVKTRYYFLNPVSVGSVGKFGVHIPLGQEMNNPIGAAFGKLYNSASAIEKERAKLINKSDYYYCLAQVVEDLNRPELQGKIVIFKFSKQIYDKIEMLKTPISNRTPKMDAFDVFNAPELELVVKKKNADSTTDKMPTYDLTTFTATPTPLTINGKQISKDKEGVAALREYLSTAPDLDTVIPKQWNDELTLKVNAYVNSLFISTKSAIANAQVQSSAPSVSAPNAVSQNVAFNDTFSNVPENTPANTSPVDEDGIDWDFE